MSLPGWALILGASSGFGEATSIALAEAGMNIFGVHLDRRATMPHVDEIRAKIEKAGRQAKFFNVNAADEGKRKEVLDEIARTVQAEGKEAPVRVLLHSLAFGTLRPFIASDEERLSVA